MPFIADVLLVNFDDARSAAGLRLLVAESERVLFDGREGRRRAVLVDLTKTRGVTADDFPMLDDGGGREPFKSRYGWRDDS